MMISTPAADIPYFIQTGERWDTWLKRIPTGFRFLFYYEPDVLEKIRPFGSAMKASSDLTFYWDEPIEFLVNKPTSYGAMLKHAITTPTTFPYPQANANGAYRYLWKPLVKTPAADSKQILSPAVAVSAV
jgi:hypothetical protein